MGVYLSSPVTDKESIDGVSKGFVYGASSMQGWRTTQEDAHNCIPEFNKSSDTSFFAVYDGHGGSEVAKYCERHFPDFVKELLESSDPSHDISKLIKQAFLAFDATLTVDDVVKELKELAGKDDEAEEEDEEDPVGRTETDRLKEEANMPLDQLLAQYKPDSKPSETAQFQSPALRAKPSSRVQDPSKNGESSESGQPEAGEPSSSSKCPLEQSSSASADQGASSSSSQQSASSPSTLPNGKVKNSNSYGEDSANSPDTSNKEGNSSNNNNLVGKSDGSSVEAEAEGSSSKQEAGGSGSSSKSRASKDRAVAGMAERPDSSDDDDDDDDDEEEEMWEDMSDEDDDEEEEEGDDEDVPMMDMTNEEPGSDSGCTACVLLMQGKKLIVANAGDSRCVLARGGKAVELSFDHKPEDQPERERIEKAGGKVTSDGRVNGGLNLSRAIGDHVYKRNDELPAKDQMITALPDIETTELQEQDQFIVIACDGIWNYMSSQEVVDYVMVKLKDPDKKRNPSRICEELFDNCLAPNTYGDGTGCDNMTCIIIVLDSFVPTETTSEPSGQVDVNSHIALGLKRSCEEVEGSEEKRTKTEEDV